MSDDGSVPAFTLPLREAVDHWKQQPGASANAYDWYRKSAQRNGQIWLGRDLQLGGGGNIHVGVQKVGRSWMVDKVAFESALLVNRTAKAETADITTAYDEHRLLVAPGHSLGTTWGGYSVRQDFHQTWSNRPISYGGGSVTWYCNTCWNVAEQERNKPECHRCSDWSPCNDDCTLSAISCEACGTSLVFWTAPP
jgi:hypothetical protein